MSLENDLLMFRDACRRHLLIAGSELRHLFYEKLPLHLLSSEYLISIKIQHLEWKNDYKIVPGRGERGHQWEGLEILSYEESCVARLKIELTTTIIIPIDISEEIRFDALSRLVDSERHVLIFAHNEYSEAIINFHKLVTKTQVRFDLIPISMLEFDNKSLFIFYTDIVRKDRQSQPANNEIKSQSYLNHLSQAHTEISVYIGQALLYMPMIDDLLARKAVEGEDTFYLPNVNYYTHQFLRNCTSAFERLYTYWETAIALFCNYEKLGFKGDNPSFGKFFRRLIEHFQQEKPSVFHKDSLNIKWLLDFFTTDYDAILDYRHRFVHHKFTSTNDGLLSAKFEITAWQNVAKKEELEKLKAEVRNMPVLLVKHFNLCVEGFKRMVYSIEELE